MLNYLTASIDMKLLISTVTRWVKFADWWLIEMNFCTYSWKILNLMRDTILTTNHVLAIMLNNNFQIKIKLKQQQWEN